MASPFGGGAPVRGTGAEGALRRVAPSVTAYAVTAPPQGAPGGGRPHGAALRKFRSVVTCRGGPVCPPSRSGCTHRCAPTRITNALHGAYSVGPDDPAGRGAPSGRALRRWSVPVRRGRCPHRPASDASRRPRPTRYAPFRSSSWPDSEIARPQARRGNPSLRSKRNGFPRPLRGSRNDGEGERPGPPCERGLSPPPGGDWGDSVDNKFFA